MSKQKKFSQLIKKYLFSPVPKLLNPSLQVSFSKPYNILFHKKNINSHRWSTLKTFRENIRNNFISSNLNCIERVLSVSRGFWPNALLSFIAFRSFNKWRLSLTAIYQRNSHYNCTTCIFRGIRRIIAPTQRQKLCIIAHDTRRRVQCLHYNRSWFFFLFHINPCNLLSPKCSKILHLSLSMYAETLTSFIFFLKYTCRASNRYIKCIPPWFSGLRMQVHAYIDSQNDFELSNNKLIILFGFLSRTYMLLQMCEGGCAYI